MKDQFSDQFSLIPICDVSIVNGNTYILYSTSNVKQLISDNDIVVTQNPERSDSGLQYKMSASIVVDKNETLKEFNKFPVIVVLKTLNGLQKVWGNQAQPVTVDVAPDPVSDKMLINLNSVSLYPIW